MRMKKKRGKWDGSNYERLKNPWNNTAGHPFLFYSSLYLSPSLSTLSFSFNLSPSPLPPMPKRTRHGLVMMAFSCSMLPSWGWWKEIERRERRERERERRERKKKERGKERREKNKDEDDERGMKMKRTKSLFHRFRFSLSLWGSLPGQKFSFIPKSSSNQLTPPSFRISLPLSPFFFSLFLSLSSISLSLSSQNSKTNPLILKETFDNSILKRIPYNSIAMMEGVRSRESEWVR